MFCYRVAEGKIGANQIWNINNKKRDIECLINGNKIERKDGKQMGVYRFEDDLITWTDEDGDLFVWARSGILKFLTLCIHFQLKDLIFLYLVT